MNGIGDDWGSFGGYRDWDVSNNCRHAGHVRSHGLPHRAICWFVDNSPEASLTSDLAARKPQQFKPKAGKVLQWPVTRLSHNQILQGGTTTVGADDGVSITGITLFRDPDRVAHARE